MSLKQPELNVLGIFWPLQVSSQWGQSSSQEAGAAGHGPATETLAVQAPGQPLPHKNREGPAGSGLAHDSSAGEKSLCNGKQPISVRHLVCYSI